MILKMELSDRRKWKTGRFMEVYGSREGGHAEG